MASRNANRWLLLAPALLLAAVAFAACGTRHTRSGGFPTAEGSRDGGLQSTDSVLAELDALACPEGVDSALWAELKAALEAAFLSKEESRFSNRDSLSTESRLESRDSGVGKFVSTPPAGETNRVNDLSIADNGDGTYTLNWHYRNLGDYGQDGVVGISDITPLAQHFQETWSEGEEDTLAAVIDGSGNGKVDIADVTPIAQHFGIEVADYLIEGATALEGPFSGIEAVPVGNAAGGESGRAVMEHVLTPGEYTYFRVTPRDAAGTAGVPSNTVGLALQILSVTPTEVKEGTVVTFSAEVLGAGPLTYAWDFGGQAQFETYTEPSPRVVLTRETGEFPASLTVTGLTGADTFPFTLTKLAREWKYEVVLEGASGDAKGFSLQEFAGELWFYAHGGGYPAAKYLVHGLPGNWSYEEISQRGWLVLASDGHPAFLYVAGSPLDEWLYFSERREHAWDETLIARAMAFGAAGVAFGPEDDPFVAYKGVGMGLNANTLYYARRDGSGWQQGVLSSEAESGEAGTEMISMDGTPDFQPMVTFYNQQDSGTSQLTYARWDDVAKTWSGGPIDTDDESGVYKTGYFPAIKYDPNGVPGCAYSQITDEVAPGLRDDRLIFGKLLQDTWVCETVRERVRPLGVTNTFEWKALAYDPLGNAVIAYLYYRGTEAIPRRGVVVEWRDSGGWTEIPVYLSGEAAFGAISAAFDQWGTLYVLYGDSTNEEVILARYE